MKKILLTLILTTLLGFTACGSGLGGSFKDRDNTEFWKPEVTAFFLNSDSKLVAEFKVSTNKTSSSAANTSQTFTYNISFDAEQIATEDVEFTSGQEVTLISPSVAESLKAGQHEAIACIHQGTLDTWENGLPKNSACKNLRF